MPIKGRAVYSCSLVCNQTPGWQVYAASCKEILSEDSGKKKCKVLDWKIFCESSMLNSLFWEWVVVWNDNEWWWWTLDSGRRCSSDDEGVQRRTLWLLTEDEDICRIIKRRSKYDYSRNFLVNVSELYQIDQIWSS